MKHWKCLVSEKDAKANINSIELKFSNLFAKLYILKFKTKFSASV